MHDVRSFPKSRSEAATNVLRTQTEFKANHPREQSSPSSCSPTTRATHEPSRTIYSSGCKERRRRGQLDHGTLMLKHRQPNLLNEPNRIRENARKTRPHNKTETLKTTQTILRPCESGIHSVIVFRASCKESHGLRTYPLLFFFLYLRSTQMCHLVTLLDL